jgi:hypothetical protein
MIRISRRQTCGLHKRTSGQRRVTFWHTSGLPSESVEFLESIAIEICKLQTLRALKLLE